MKVLLLSFVVLVGTVSATKFKRDPAYSQNVKTADLRYQTGNDVECDLCKMAVKDIQTLLSGKSQQVEEFLESLCTKLSDEYQQECRSLVEEYIPLLFEVIDNMSTEEICDLLQLCGQTSRTSAILLRKFLTLIDSTDSLMEGLHKLSNMNGGEGDSFDLLMTKKVPQHAKCEICAYLSSAVEGILVYNKDELKEDLTELYTDICNVLPPDMKALCNAEEVYIDVVIQSLQKLFSPDTMCKEVFSICSQGTTTAPPKDV